MEYIDNKWKADEGKLFVRMSDSEVMGDVLYLSAEDSIENYMERAFTEEERKAFEDKYSFGKQETEDSGNAPIGDDEI